MSAEIPAEALQLRSLVRADQILELFLDAVPVPDPGPDEVVIRVEAAPLNPSDMGLLFGGADMAAAVASGPADRPVVTAPIPDAAMRGLAGRVGAPLPVDPATRRSSRLPSSSSPVQPLATSPGPPWSLTAA